MSRSETKPLQVSAIFAHPDDETMFLGGTLAYLARQGAEVHYVSATLGEGGDVGDPPICVREDLGACREQELRCAVEALGGSSLELLEYQDPLVGPEGELFPFSEGSMPAREKISFLLQKQAPDLIITHGPEGEYGHPAHIQVHQAVVDALEILGWVDAGLYFPSWLSRETGRFTPTPDLMLDVEICREEKTAAALCHRTQHALFIHHGSARAGRPVSVPEMVRTREGLVRGNIKSKKNLPCQLEEALADLLIPFEQE